jgi:hypothetical protein
MRALYEKNLNRDVIPLPAFKVCSACKESRPIQEFSKKYSSAGGVASRCNRCRAKDQTSWRQRNPDKATDLQLQTKYGITLDDYNRLLIAQNGKCAICGSGVGGQRAGKSKRLAVDHCHSTGVVRGLLCEQCNTGLGKFRDDPEILQAAVKYLKA